MNRSSFHSLPGPFRLRWLASGVCTVGWPLLALGCAERGAAMMEQGSSLPERPVAAAPPSPYRSGVHQAAYQPDEPVVVVVPEATPINLDAVFRLAEGGNKQIALAREKLNQSQIENQLAAKAWLPNVSAGVGYFRHEGGIQNEDGTLTRSSSGALFPGVELRTEMDVREATYHRIDAERKRLQQQGELAKVDNETLLDAASTYIDLLTARRGEAVNVELEAFSQDVLKRAKALAKEGGAVLVEGVETDRAGRAQAAARLHQQGDAASAKLTYLLGLDPHSPLVPVDESLTPIDLVDATVPVDDLVARALTSGPGVHELESILGVIQGGIAESTSLRRFLPSVELNVTEGAFGAGPGSHLDWSNRLDVCVGARWNLTEWVNARERKMQALSGQRQAELSLEDLRGKLTLGVREAREAILAGREQIRQGAEQIRHASESYRLTKLRLDQNIPGASPAELLQSLHGLELAHFNYLSAVSAYNKAQIRLLLLLGPGNVAHGCKPERHGGA